MHHISKPTMWGKASIYRLILPTLALILIAGTALLRFVPLLTHAASAAGPVSFTGTLSPLVAHSHLIGPADASQRISLTIGLRPRDANGLVRYAQDIANPKSVNFHRYLSSAQITDIFGPTVAAHTAVLQFSQSSGFH